MQIRIDIPDSVADAVLTSFAALHGYEEMVINPDYDIRRADRPLRIPNPQTKRQFVAQYLQELVLEGYITQDAENAAKEARKVRRQELQQRLRGD